MIEEFGFACDNASDPEQHATVLRTVNKTISEYIANGWRLLTLNWDKNGAALEARWMMAR